MVRTGDGARSPIPPAGELYGSLEGGVLPAHRIFLALSGLRAPGPGMPFADVHG
jgi:hypothetical protein